MSKIPLFPNKFAIFASILGVPLNSNKLKILIGVEGNSAIDAVQSFYNNLPTQSIFLAHVSVDTQQLVVGYKANNDYGAAIGVAYTTGSAANVYCIQIYNGTWTKTNIL